ncbi:transient receptor potential cation channel subfamily a member 1 [Anaeramoeba flamelloides]|uniref:Transient receptor potential cation channel subfamily a member 1 n=1 Tax=Anaeramoeba flamelloides TaxID=1746091 RepID=A0ABQ8YYB3_9EUKA|nr:transient receptor potential cation channel subfamily a member 1 [Anaeramoeba flamelloides]
MNKNNVYELTSKEIVNLRNYSLREVKSRIDFENLKQIIVDPFYSKQRTMTFLHYFCLYQPTPTILTYLLFLGLDPNVLSSDRHTSVSIYFSRKKYDLEVIKLLVENGGRLDLISKENNPLLKLLKENKLKIGMINYLIEKGCAINCVEKKTGCTLLHLLCKGRRKKDPYALLKTLISKGVNMNTKDKSGHSALDCIFFSKTKFNFSILKIFVQNGYDLRNLNPKNSPLITCCKEISLKEDVVCYLIDNGIDVNFQLKENGNTGLHYLTINNTLTETMFDKMMRSGLKINLENHQGLTAFNYFCQNKKLVLNYEFLKKFITNGSDLKKINFTENPLFVYCSQKVLSFEAINLLINSGIDLNFKQYPSKTGVLMQLCNRADLPLELIDNFLKKDRKTINYQDKRGWTALIHACHAGKSNLLPVIKTLIANGADVNISTDSDYTALEVYANRKNTQKGVAKLLIRSGSKLNRSVNSHIPVLQLFSQKKAIINFPIIKNLLKHGADVNTRANNGSYLIHLIASCQNPDLELFQLLTKYNAEINPVNRLSETPLHLLCRNPHTTIEALKYLIENGANLNAEYKNGKNVLHILLEQKDINLPVLQLLLEMGADPNLSCDWKQTALHLLLQRKDVDIRALDLLLKFGADWTLKDSRHVTPLYQINNYNNMKLEILECFVKYSKSVTVLNSLLQFVCQLIPLDIRYIKLLVSEGAQLISLDEKKSPLIYYCSRRRVLSDNINYLIENGIDVNAIGSSGKPAISLLAERGMFVYLKTFQLLIEKGADINPISFFNETPLQLHIKSKTPNYKIVKFFVKNGADLNFKNLLEYQENTDLIIKGVKVHSKMIQIRLSIKPIVVKYQLEEYSEEVVKYFLNWLYFDEKKYLLVLNDIFQKFSINNPQKKTLRKDLFNYYSFSKDFDFDLIVDEEKIPCHKLILQARSNVFRGFFTSINENVNSIHDQSGKSYNALKLFIKFLYTDQINPKNIAHDELSEIQELGDYYQLNINSPYNYYLDLSIEKGLEQSRSVELRDLEDEDEYKIDSVFSKYGNILSIEKFKYKKGTPYFVIQYSKSFDAYKAATHLNSTKINGNTIHVQLKQYQSSLHFSSSSPFAFRKFYKDLKFYGPVEDISFKSYASVIKADVNFFFEKDAITCHAEFLKLNAYKYPDTHCRIFKRK